MNNTTFLSVKEMKKLYKQDKQDKIIRFWDFSVLENLPEVAELPETKKKYMFNKIYNSLTSISDFTIIDFYNNNQHIYIDLDFALYRIDNDYKMLYRFYKLTACRVTIYNANGYYNRKPLNYYEVGVFGKTLKSINHVTISA